MKLTEKGKLLTTDEQYACLQKTMKTFNEACNYISGRAFESKTFRTVNLHHLVYRETREKFPALSAQFVVRAIGKAADSYVNDQQSLHGFKQLSAVLYDPRILSFKDTAMVSINTDDGRQKIPLVFGPSASFEKSQMKGQADLTFERGKFYLNVVIEVPEGTPLEPVGFLGVDFGITNLATTSEGHTFSGQEVDSVRERTTKLKKALQQCGSKSAKRHLKKLSGTEARFKRTTNHGISKKIVSEAQGTCRGIALEDLKGFNGRQTVGKAHRERFGKWAFGQLREFIEYKAQRTGVPVIAVDPYNTSITCSACHYVSKSNRKSQAVFSCQCCGLTMHADLNAAINIAARASVNAPIAVRPPVPTAPSPGTANSVQPGLLTPCALGTG